MPKFEKPNIYEALVEVPARVDNIVHLRTMVVDVSAGEAVNDLFELMTPDELKKMLPQVTGENALSAFLEGDLDLIEETVQALKIFGFIVRISTPVVNGTGGCSSYSWAFYTSRAFYAETYEDALQAGLMWAQQVHEERVHAWNLVKVTGREGPTP